MFKSKLVGLISVCMIAGPPAAELMHESDKAEHHEALPPGSHDHPFEEHDTSYVGPTYNAVFTTSSPRITVAGSTPRLENRPSMVFHSVSR